MTRKTGRARTGTPGSTQKCAACSHYVYTSNMAAWFYVELTDDTAPHVYTRRGDGIVFDVSGRALSHVCYTMRQEQSATVISSLEHLTYSIVDSRGWRLSMTWSASS